MKTNKGFTLIEVLIASVILFATLAITADLYKTSTFSANKVIEKTRYLQSTATVISTIKSELTLLTSDSIGSSYEGIVIVRGIEFKWRAERISFKARVKRIDETSEPPRKFGLYSVRVTVLNRQKLLEKYEFKVATW